MTDERDEKQIMKIEFKCKVAMYRMTTKKKKEEEEEDRSTTYLNMNKQWVS